jgi:SAM-dependent methyltransferase
MFENTLQVQALYERRPYPHYPLWAKPLWQDGYLGSSLFSSQLLLGRARDSTATHNFLSIGPGEILPYIIRQWEPSATNLHCVDLSQRSLNRAKFRTALLGKRVSYYRDDINNLLPQQPFHQMIFDHAEAYGVLHHIPTFKTTLDLVRQRLSPNGIFRIMVYNRHARDWIWDINRAFAQLNLQFNSDRDVAVARRLLKKLALLSPRLSQRLSQMGRTSLENNSRFADTFLHPWESRASIKTWFSTFQSAGLRPMALYDRYGELDDLQNPLWKCPTAAQLTDRALDLRFENNLELWLMRDDYQAEKNKSLGQDHRPSSNIPWRLRMTLPTQRFNVFNETKTLSFTKKIAIWHGFLRTLYQSHSRSAGEMSSLIGTIKKLDLQTTKRLARMGLILPSVARAAGLDAELLRPLTQSMSPPELPRPAGDIVKDQVTLLCGELHAGPPRTTQAVRRLIRAM